VSEKIIKLSTAIITYNEERKLAECLKSVSFSDEIIIVDSNSTDRTREIAKEAKAVVCTRPFDDFSSQKNYAVSLAKGEWILSIDADERVTKELEWEIKKIISVESNFVGYNLTRQNFIFGGRMRFGASLTDFQLRLIRRGKGKFQGLMHERIQAQGAVGTLKAPLIHVTYQTLDEYYAKFNRGSSLDARELLRQNKKTNWFGALTKPIVHFVYFYFFKLGFLDGIRGLVYQILSSHYVFVKDVKAMEYSKAGKWV